MNKNTNDYNGYRVFQNSAAEKETELKKIFQKKKMRLKQLKFYIKLH